MVQRKRVSALRIAVCLVGIGLGGVAGSLVGAQQAQSPSPLVDKFVLKDTVQPVTEGELTQALARANRDGAQALLVEMDTPGGLVESMRAMVAAMMASKVPVIVFVGPSGAPARRDSFCLRLQTWRPWPRGPRQARRMWSSWVVSPMTRKHKRWRTMPRRFCART